MNGDPRRQIREADDQHAVCVNLFIDLRSGHISAALYGQIDDNRTLGHAADHVFGDDYRRFAAKQLGGGNDNIGDSANFSHPLALLLELFFGQRFGITVFGLAGFTQIDFYKTRTQGFYLLFHHRAGVECFDPSPQTFGGGNRLQPRDADSDDEHPGGGDGSCRRHHHWQNFIEPFGRQDNRHITGQIGLGA